MIDPAIPCAALDEGKRLQLRYDGYQRVVEVHAVGLSSERHWLMRIWQVGGGSKSSQPFGWKLMRLDHASNPIVTNEISNAPRAGYERGDKAMSGGIKRQI